MRRDNPFDSFLRFVRRSRAPFSISLLAALVLVFLVVWLGWASDAVRAFVSALIFTPKDWAARPWSVLTYGLFSGDLLPLLAIGIVLYFFASALERRWGTRRFATAFLTIVLLAPLSFWLGWLFTGRSVTLVTLGLPAACCVVAWATLYPRQPIMLWFVIPVEARWVGWLTAAGVVIGYGWGDARFAFFAGLPVLLAYLYAAERLSLPSLSGAQPRPRRKPLREGDYEGLDPDKRLQAERERRKLKELFERSMGDDPGESGENLKS